MKFGGASLGTAGALKQVLSIILEQRQRCEQLLIIASALEGVTDMLLEAAQLARVANRRGYRRIAATLRTRHMALVDQLSFDDTARSALKADIDQLLFDMLDQCQKVADSLDDELTPSMSDAVVAVGERLSVQIIAALLRQHDIRGIAVDGADLLVTDDVHGNASPLLSLTSTKVQDILLPILDRGLAPVVSGFIGAAENGATTTLGRGGSDYTASILSALIEADELWIWADVDGMMSADPRDVSGARVIPMLDYDEAAELAYFGARILHARMIQPLAEKSLPLRIKNVYKPAEMGTLIAAGEPKRQATIKAVTSIQALALSRQSSGSMAGVTRLVGNTLFKTLGMRSEVMIASQSSSSSFLCLVIPTSIGIDGLDRLQRALTDKMAEHPQKMPWEISSAAVVTAIGSGLSQAPRLLGAVIDSLDDIPVAGLATGPSDCSISVALSPSDALAALQRIHELTAKSG